MSLNNKLGFGLMRLPLKNENELTSIDQDQVNKMVDYFMSKGFEFFDTAYPYHGGMSEQSIKKALVDKYPRENYKLCNKMPSWLVKSEEDYQKFFQVQIERCGVDYFDYYLLHVLGEENYDLTIKHNGFEFMKTLKAEGKAKHIGFSAHDNAEFVDKVLTQHPEMEFVLLQINYLDWESENIEARKCYEVANKHNTPVMIMEPLKGGSLVNVPESVEKMYKEHNPDMSIASWALRFAASLDNIITVFSGMSNYEQMLDNVSVMEDFQAISSEEQGILDKAIDLINDSIAIPCTNCNYCMDDCPNEIPIPKYFSLYNQQDQFGFDGNFLEYYRNLAQEFVRASECNECNICEEHCPQNIKIADNLKLVSEVFDKELDSFKAENASFNIND